MARSARGRHRIGSGGIPAGWRSLRPRFASTAAGKCIADQSFGDGPPLLIVPESRTSRSTRCGYSAANQTAACSLRERLHSIGLEIRAGLHGGEVEARGDAISGAVVNVTARVEQAAADGEICVTTAVQQMLIGSAHEFETIGSRELKGFEGEWRLYRLIHT